MRILVLVLVLLGGCTALKPSSDEHQLVGAIVESTLASLEAPSENRHQGIAAAELALQRQPDGASGLRLALLLATLPPPQRNEGRALALLEGIAAQIPATPVTRFAGLFADQVRERMNASRAASDMARREEEARRREAEARLAAEEREQELERRLSALKALESREAALLRRQAEALRAGEQREDTLRRQIERLRASERKLIEREETLGAKAR